ncbi:hypothetical protein [Aquimarina sp. 2201CG14-23]|uniref:hypothetical protein n=1 Tax=Aquimarina mycalae TaxID=3040073 RepID=UPI0024780686|nr:hypothetical protein [Aquimarina sp. 2201CG14-23]MDH7445838.1 hypothetical protein [Aquimarina sp. 2201CG14-23]
MAAEDTKHGYVTETSLKNDRIMIPHPDVVHKRKSPTIEVGKRTYRLEGDTRDVLDFLKENKDVKLVASTIEGASNNMQDNIAASISEPGIQVGTPQQAVLGALKKATETLAEEAVGGITAVTSKIPVKAVQKSVEIITTTQSVIGVVKPALEILSKKEGEDLVDAINSEPKQGIEKLDKLLESIGNGVDAARKLPIIGGIINELTSNPIIVEINPYTNPNEQSNTAYIQGENTTMTFGQLAEQIAKEVLNKKIDATHRVERTEMLTADQKKGTTNLQYQTSEKKLQRNQGLLDSKKQYPYAHKNQLMQMVVEAQKVQTRTKTLATGSIDKNGKVTLDAFAKPKNELNQSTKNTTNIPVENKNIKASQTNVKGVKI